VPLTVFDADPFIDMPVAPPNVTGAVTVIAFADAAGLLNDTRITKLVPATYVPVPLKAVKLVIVNDACALIAMTTLLVIGPNDRPEYSSVPATVVVIVTVGWLGAPASIVIRKSMFKFPLIVFATDTFAEMPDAPPNVSGDVTVIAFADVAGLLSVTRMTNVVPATWVPLPLKAVKLVIDNAACALMLIPNALLGPALNGRVVISSLPETVAVIDNG